MKSFKDGEKAKLKEDLNIPPWMNEYEAESLNLLRGKNVKIRSYDPLTNVYWVQEFTGSSHAWAEPNMLEDYKEENILQCICENLFSNGCSCGVMVEEMKQKGKYKCPVTKIWKLS